MKTLAERLADLQAAQERERRADMEVHRALSAAGVREAAQAARAKAAALDALADALSTPSERKETRNG